MTRQFALIVALLGALFTTALLQGCGSSSAKAVGTYELDKEAMKAAVQAEVDQTEDPMEKMGKSMMLGMLDSLSMTFELKADGTFDGTSTMMGETDTVKGNWSLKGSTITFKMSETDPGDPEEMTGTLSGGTITLIPPDDEDAPFNLIFHKKKA
ncbi:MAG: hypothetical protein ACIAQF_04790 [Phycisphaerales bacterium JB065]